LNWLDIVIAVILLASGIAALRNGITREIIRLVALAVGVAGSLWFYDRLAVQLTFIDTPALAKFVAFLSILFGCVIIGTIISWLLDKFWGVTGLRFVDRLLGGAFGVARGWIAATIMLVGLVAFVPIAGVERAVAASRLAPMVLHSARLVTYVAPASLRQAYSDNFEKVRQVWSSPAEAQTSKPINLEPAPKPSPSR
jgi:membrane protein required for colicin V production